jgi:Leucine-rich repeat (LRR) protein
VENATITRKDVSIDVITGEHTAKSTVVDVLYFTDTSAIKYLPINIHEHFPRLKKLEINDNGLKIISNKELANLFHLVSVEIKNTFLSIIPDGTFDDTTKLEHLTLNKNRIRTLGMRIFTKLVNLKRLWMSDNLLETLPAQIFATNKNLIDIDVSYNRLRVIDVEIFDLLPTTDFTFDGNFCITETNRDVKSVIREKCDGDAEQRELLKIQNLKSEIHNQSLENERLQRKNLALHANLTRARDENSQLQNRLNNVIKRAKNLESSFANVMENLTACDEMINQGINSAIELHKCDESSNVLIKTGVVVMMCTLTIVFITCATFIIAKVKQKQQQHQQYSQYDKCHENDVEVMQIKMLST